MKNKLLVTTLLVALSITSFAKEKNVDSRLFKDLSSTLQNSAQVRWTTKDQYKQAAFSFRNKMAAAYYDLENNELIGFRIQLNKTDLPRLISEALKNKYADWEVVDAITFIDASGYVSYFAQVHKDNKNFVIKITPNGKSSVYARMHG
ncbi:MAG TPA: hypothetical protein VFW07_21015 [Parafilimonas sp.]|nr:hypothetical protein [Parafilimonas sp.]